MDTSQFVIACQILARGHEGAAFARVEKIGGQFNARLMIAIVAIGVVIGALDCAKSYGPATAVAVGHTEIRPVKP